MIEPGEHAKALAHEVAYALNLTGEQEIARISQHHIDAAVAEAVAEYKDWHKAEVEHAVDKATSKLIAERDALKAERDALMGEASVGPGFEFTSNDWRRLRQEATDRADRAEAACAQMREACQLALDYCVTDCDIEHLAEVVAPALEKALSTDAGRGWVPIEDVKPLLDTSYAGDTWRSKIRDFLAKHGDKLRRSDEAPLQRTNEHPEP